MKIESRCVATRTIHLAIDREDVVTALADKLTTAAKKKAPRVKAAVLREAIRAQLTGVVAEDLQYAVAINVTDEPAVPKEAAPAN